MTEKKPGWASAITLGAALLTATILGPRLKSFLVAREWSEFGADVAAVFAGGLLLTATFLAVARRRVSGSVALSAAFVLITLTLIYAVQLGLHVVGENLGLPLEVSHYGSWLLAIVVVAWPAEIAAKRMGINLMPKR